MDWADRCCLARVRALALNAMVTAGGKPSAAALARVVEPILGDVAPWEPSAGRRHRSYVRAGRKRRLKRAEL
jgi:hypothetical protein